ncbi:GNAT family protein [Exiguobacterium sp. SL14]|nr:GNAT family protein [Exiguobacterium sp. SL14]MCY1690864.1 GNAT family protein [Exiguobacterium sp. SL14]
MLPIYIRPYVLDDAAAILDVNLRNREHFEYWMPVKPLPEQYTLDGRRERIFRHQELMKQDAYYAYGVYLTENDQLIGDVSAMFIQRGLSRDVHDRLSVRCHVWRKRIYGSSGRIVRGSSF